jgi:suppressor for copper-sensitivity B
MRRDIPQFVVLLVAVAGWLIADAPGWAQAGEDQLGSLFGVSGGGESVVSVAAQFTAPTADQPARLYVTATMEPGWHIYSITQPKGGTIPSEIRLQPSKAYRLLGDFQASPPPKKHPEPLYDNLVLEEHYGRVVWQAPIQFADGVDLATLKIQGSLYAQACKQACIPPRDYPFTATLGPAVPLAGPEASAPAPAPPGPTPPGPVEAPASPDAGPPPAPAEAGPQGEAADAGPRFMPEAVRPEEIVQATSLGMALLFAFGGGLILNVMPCVLPVIGLKILAFFNQAGESRGRAFVLNVWYAFGLVSVFLVLAALGVGLSEMFTEELFGIIMAAVVFAMALSLMGLWELQVPGFLGSGKTLKIAEKEGPAGAFFKGVITTLLAIPCGAPLLSPALKWADDQVRAGAPANVYVAFGVIGLGMATPYLVIGAFPELLRFLPKPGAWMDTFKHLMGYLLLVAVIWILYFLPIEDVVPTIGLLFGLWLACWLIGRVAPTASTKTRAWAWGLAVLALLLPGLASFIWLRPAMQRRLDNRVAAEVTAGQHDDAVQNRFTALQIESAKKLAKNLPNGTEPTSFLEPLLAPNPGGRGSPLASEAGQPGTNPAAGAELPWQPFNRALFERLVAAGKTVLVDFTADWCLTCKTLEALVLNTRPTREMVDHNGVVALRADWTRGAPEVTEMMEILGSKQVPVVAIFPAGDPNHPIVLRGGFSRQTLLEALEKAGPSADAPAAIARGKSG